MKKLIYSIVALLSGVTSVNAAIYAFADGDLYFSVLSVDDATVKAVAPIGDAAADYLLGATSVSVPATATNSKTGITYKVVEIGVDAFADNPTLEDVTIPEGVTKVNSFYNLPNLRSVTLPASLEYVGGFVNLPALETLDLPDGITTIDYYAFQRLTSLTSVRIPQGVTQIRDFVFNSCPAITSFAMPGIEFIDEYCLNFPSLKRLTFPASLKSTGWCAISGGMEELWFESDGSDRQWTLSMNGFRCRPTAIYCEHTTPPSFIYEDAFLINEEYGSTDDNMFGGLENMKSITLYVPVGTAEAYRATPYWGTMQIVEYDFNAGIAVPKADQGDAERTPAIYDLAGRKIDGTPATPGIYVSQGKKFHHSGR